MTEMSIRSTYFSGFILAILLLLLSVYLQVVDGILPCPLCAFQRAVFGILGVLFLSGFLAYKIRPFRVTINLLTTLASILGIVLAGRQIWLQHYPPANNECGVSLQYMMQTFPLNEVIKKTIFEGSAECTARGWEFFYLNMAEWSLIWFAIFFVLSFMLFLKKTDMQKRIY